MTAVTTPDLSFLPEAASRVTALGTSFTEIRQLRRERTLMVATTALVGGIVSVTALACTAMVLGVTP